MEGVPVADATQWEQIEAVARCGYGVFGYLETVAMQGELIYQDDTSVRILTLMQENEQIRARAAAQGLSRATECTGMFTTALVVRVGERLIALYYSGRAHAGENLATLLQKREAAQEPPLAMSDALSCNEVEDGLVVRCHCAEFVKSGELRHSSRIWLSSETRSLGACTSRLFPIPAPVQYENIPERDDRWHH